MQLIVSGPEVVATPPGPLRSPLIHPTQLRPFLLDPGDVSNANYLFVVFKLGSIC